MKKFKSSDKQGGSGDGKYYYECDICHCLLSKDDHGINSNCLQCQIDKVKPVLDAAIEFEKNVTDESTPDFEFMTVLTAQANNLVNTVRKYRGE